MKRSRPNSVITGNPGPEVPRRDVWRVYTEAGYRRRGGVARGAWLRRGAGVVLRPRGTCGARLTLAGGMPAFSHLMTSAVMSNCG